MSLDQVAVLPARQVGKKALALARLAKLKVRISDGFVIPTETIKQIAHHNQLFQKIKIIEETTDWENDFAVKTNLRKIRSLIAKQSIPTDLAQTIAKSAEKLIDQGWFLQAVAETNLVENIHGATNLLESVLKVWSLDYVRGEPITPAILVLGQLQPTISGVAKIDPTRKNYAIIKAVRGVYDHQLGVANKPDLFEVNLSTLSITSRHLHPRKIILKRQLDGLTAIKTQVTNQPALTDQQAQAVASICQSLNRQTLGRRKLYFEIQKEKILVSKIFEPSTKTDFEAEVLLLGQSITGGYIEGLVQVVAENRDERNFGVGSILVKKSLDHLDQPLLLKASAVVIDDRTISPALLEFIHQHHLPTIVGTNFATTKLISQQRVIVDAGGGRVLRPPSLEQPQTAIKTLTKVYLSAGNPFRTQSYPEKAEGIFLKSDYAIAFAGIHPDQLLKNQPQQFWENLTHAVQIFLGRQADQLFYRACNLNSFELGSLQGAVTDKKIEPNPYLGTRGALRILENDTLFKAELEILNQISSKKKSTIHFVLPWVRTATELALLFKKIEQQIPNHPYLKFWLQLNTPANVFNLDEFLHLPIAGITIQAKTIHDLTYGLDPDNPELDRAYTFDNRLMVAMLENIVKVIKKSTLFAMQTDRTLPVILKLNHYQSELVTAATKLGLQAVVVKPSLFAIVKQQIIATQESLLK